MLVDPVCCYKLTWLFVVWTLKLQQQEISWSISSGAENKLKPEHNTPEHLHIPRISGNRSLLASEGYGLRYVDIVRRWNVLKVVVSYWL